MIKVIQIDSWPMQRKYEWVLDTLGVFESQEAAENKLGWYFMAECCVTVPFAFQ